jgi:hypothetical protein
MLFASSQEKQRILNAQLSRNHLIEPGNILEGFTREAQERREYRQALRREPPISRDITRTFEW